MFQSELNTQLKTCKAEDKKVLEQLKQESKQELKDLHKLKNAKTVEALTKEYDTISKREKEAFIKKLKDLQAAEPSDEELEKQKKEFEEHQKLINDVVTAAQKLATAKKSGKKDEFKTSYKKFQAAQSALAEHDFDARQKYEKSKEGKEAKAAQATREAKQMKTFEILKIIAEKQQNKQEKKEMKKTQQTKKN